MIEMAFQPLILAIVAMFLLDKINEFPRYRVV
jgi:hypothetical protein